MSDRRTCENVDAAGEEFARRMFAGTLHNIANVITAMRMAIADLETAHDEENLAIIEALLEELLPPLEEAVRENRAATFLTPAGPGAEYLHSIRQLLEHHRNALALQQQGVSSIHRKLLHISEIIVLQQRLLSGRADAETVAIEESVEAALAMMDELVRKQQVKVMRDFAADHPARADRAILIQVLINLIKNALEALTKVNGRERRLDIRTWNEILADGVMHVCCGVTDNGPGISPDGLENIFEYGYSTKPEGNAGSGIGLHFCRQALGQIGGRLEVRSFPGEGASFIIILPAETVEPMALEEELS